MNKTLQQDDALMKSLGLVTINRLICYTDKGMLTLQIRKGDTQYHICLDSVPVDKEKNKELMELLFPIPKMEIPTVNKGLSFNGQPIIPDIKITPVSQNDINELIKDSEKVISKKFAKPKGRPKGAKNR